MLNKALIAGIFSIVVIGTLSFLTNGTDLGLFLVASFGSSMVLVLGYPESPFAKGRNVLFGHVITSLVGLICYAFFVVELAILTGNTVCRNYTSTADLSVLSGWNRHGRLAAFILSYHNE